MTLREKFDSFVDKAEECWSWRGAHSDRGYTQIWQRGKVHRAHRVAYQLFVGPIPAGKCVCHFCDNPGCVNPSHLFLASHSQNMKDCALKRRHNNSRKTHCSRGHEFTAGNTHVDRYNGWERRGCKKCRAAMVSRIYWQKKNPAVQRAGERRIT